MSCREFRFHDLWKDRFRSGLEDLTLIEAPTTRQGDQDREDAARHVERHSGRPADIVGEGK